MVRVLSLNELISYNYSFISYILLFRRGYSKNTLMIKRVTLTLDVMYEDFDRFRDKNRC
jgi:hypothetical protein